MIIFVYHRFGVGCIIFKNFRLLLFINEGDWFTIRVSIGDLFSVEFMDLFIYLFLWIMSQFLMGNMTSNMNYFSKIHNYCIHAERRKYISSPDDNIFN